MYIGMGEGPFGCEQLTQAFLLTYSRICAWTGLGWGKEGLCEVIQKQNRL